MIEIFLKGSFMKNVLNGVCVLLLAFSPMVSAKVVVGKVDVQKVLLTVNQGAAVRDQLKKSFDEKQAILKTEEEKIAFIRGELAENARAHRAVNPPTRTVRRLVTHANVAEITDGSENHPFN